MVSLHVVDNISILNTDKQEKMMQDFTAKNWTQKQLRLLYTTRSHSQSLSHTHRHTQIHLSAFRKLTHIHLQKLGKDAWAHTLYEHIWVMYTHIRAVANVCLSVCLALRGTVLISVKQYMELCCTVCGRVHSVFALSVL